MPSSQNSHDSFRSTDSYKARLELNHRKALVESVLLSAPCAPPLGEFFKDDEDAILLLHLFHDADLTIAYSNCITEPVAEPYKRMIVYHQTKTKNQIIDALILKGIERAITLPTFPKAADFVKPFPYILSMTPEPLEPQIIEALISPTPSEPDVPISSDTAEEEETPTPIPPPSQLTVCSAGNPRNARKKERGSLAFAVGLSRPYSQPLSELKEETPPPPVT